MRLEVLLHVALLAEGLAALRAGEVPSLVDQFVLLQVLPTGEELPTIAAREAVIAVHLHQMASEICLLEHGATDDTGNVLAVLMPFDMLEVRCALVEGLTTHVALEVPIHKELLLVVRAMLLGQPQVLLQLLPPREALSAGLTQVQVVHLLVDFALARGLQLGDVEVEVGLVVEVDLAVVTHVFDFVLVVVVVLSPLLDFLLGQDGPGQHLHLGVAIGGVGQVVRPIGPRVVALVLLRGLIFHHHAVFEDDLGLEDVAVLVDGVRSLHPRAIWNAAHWSSLAPLLGSGECLA